jgi:SAM-dependent methyltransferase
MGQTIAPASENRGVASVYDPIAHVFDAWSRSVIEDIPFYVREAVHSGGPVLELGVGTGRIAVPIARRGIRVIGVDDSEEMLRVCRARARAARVVELVDLRVGDLRSPPVEEQVPLILCPFRSYLHLRTDEDRRRALAAAYARLLPGGRLVFDVFAPDKDDIAETHARWLEREPGILERADWDGETRTFTLRVRADESETAMELAWVSPEEWRRLLHEAGFEVLAHFGWFDRRAYRGGEDSVWMARRPL